MDSPKTSLSLQIARADCNTQAEILQIYETIFIFFFLLGSYVIEPVSKPLTTLLQGTGNGNSIWLKTIGNQFPFHRNIKLKGEEKREKRKKEEEEDNTDLSFTCP